MNTFAKLSEITIYEKSWRNKIFLTFDLDWASDEVLQNTFERLIQLDIPATIFATHWSSYIEYLSKLSIFEIGPHPNFNFLCQGDFRYGASVSEVLDFYETFCNKKIIRSHDSFIKTEYLKEISKRGYTHESNFLIRQSHNSALRLAPFQAWGQETIRVPITWEDDEWFYGERDVNTIKEELSNQLKVFNFHPIHVYINTSCVENYNAIKHKQHDPGFLSSMINKQRFGVKDAFEQLIHAK